MTRVTKSSPALGRNDLLASFYTLSGAPNAVPARHSFEARAKAAADAGYAAIGLTMFDVDALTADGRSLEDLARVAADHGISVAEVETLGFTAPLTDAQRVDARRMFESGERLGAHHANVLLRQPPGSPVDLDAAAASFAELCTLAAEHGMIVAFEFMPFFAIATVPVAADLVERTGRDNAGLVLDSYHFYRGGSRLADLASVPKNRFVTLQLSDVPAQPAADLQVETRTARLLPGEGALPLEEFLRALDGAGSDASVGVEILSDPLRQLSAQEAAQRTADATRALLERARA
jgi:sugar phosphate isomerase/epimerase